MLPALALGTRPIGARSSIQRLPGLHRFAAYVPTDVEYGRASSLEGGPLAAPVHSRPRRGTMLLADISGYTAFMQAVAQAHAEDMMAGTFVPRAYPLLASLLDGIVERVTPPFSLSKLEGDAVFGFANDDDLQLRGGDFLGCLAACHEAYRASLEEARDLMTCDCAACSSIGDLDLKFVLHHGDYIIQSIAGRQELLGPQVTVAHLLMKNHVSDHIGRSPYALFTEAAARHLEIPLQHGVPIDEAYDHYGTIGIYVLTIPFT
jgi:class 3 adenylate cyclase